MELPPVALVHEAADEFAEVGERGGRVGHARAMLRRSGLQTSEFQTVLPQAVVKRPVLHQVQAAGQAVAVGGARQRCERREDALELLAVRPCRSADGRGP